MDIDELFEIVFAYAKKNPNFDTEFIDSVHEWYESEGDLTYRQKQALEGIVEKFNMEAKGAEHFKKHKLPW